MSISLKWCFVLSLLLTVSEITFLDLFVFFSCFTAVSVQRLNIWRPSFPRCFWLCLEVPHPVQCSIKFRRYNHMNAHPLLFILNINFRVYVDWFLLNIIACNGIKKMDFELQWFCFPFMNDISAGTESKCPQEAEIQAWNCLHWW